MIGIIGTMGEEAAILKHKLVNLNKVEVTHVKFHRGQLNNKDVILTQSGVGEVNAVISTTLLIEKSKPTLIINTSSASALDDSLSVGDILISNHVMYHDADATALRYDIDQIPQMPAQPEANQQLLQLTEKVVKQQSLTAKVDQIVSSDSFIGNSGQRLKIKRQFSEAMAIGMEVTAIAQTCYQFNLPFIVTRAVSDLVNGKAEMSFEGFLGKAAQSSSNVVEQLAKGV